MKRTYPAGSHLYTLVNGGSNYTVYDVKKSAHGWTALMTTAAGFWVVGNGLNLTTLIYQTSGGLVAQGNWDHGHYFMGDKAAAIRYYEEVSA